MHVFKRRVILRQPQKFVFVGKLQIVKTIGNLLDAETFRHRELNQLLLARQKLCKDFFFRHADGKTVGAGSQLVVVAVNPRHQSKLQRAVDNALFRQTVGNLRRRKPFANFDVDSPFNLGG